MLYFIIGHPTQLSQPDKRVGSAGLKYPTAINTYIASNRAFLGYREARFSRAGQPEGGDMVTRGRRRASGDGGRFGVMG